jgi:hypothetical protein
MKEGQTRTLKEQMDLLNSNKHRLTVWEAVHSYLDSNFIGKDGRPSKGLKSPGAFPEMVPEAIIEEIIQWMGSGPITQLQNDITSIENQHVVVINGEAKL